jgi:hypothetical protein
MSNNGKHNVQKVKSKKGFVIVCVLLLVFIGATVVYAYYTARKQVENDITLGYCDIALNENYTPPLTMAKGIEFQKEPYATNIGNVDCYVRAKSVVSDSRVTDSLTIDYDTANWTYNDEDGYWYYKKAIKPGEQTEHLFSKVVIAEDAPDIILDGFDIYVYAESIQTIDGKTMMQVWNNE